MCLHTARVTVGANKSSVYRGNAQRCFVKHVKQNAHGVERREQRYVILCSALSYHISVAHLSRRANVLRVYNVRNMSLADSLGNILATVADFIEDVRTDSVFY